MKRRTFLQVVGSAAGGYAMGVSPLAGAEQTQSNAAEERVAGLPRRVLGRTGQKLSIVGFPGLALVQDDQARGTRALHEAFERGVNYFDVAPAYGNGDCEIKMGIGLQGIDRSRIFLACKTKMRDAEGARKELEQSLTRLKTDHFDLYQMHHLVSPSQVKQAFGPGGAIETFLKAKAEGKLKYIGFSAHTTKGALAALQSFRFDTVMFPISFVEYLNRGFGKEVLEAAHEQGAAVLAIKPLSHGVWPKGMENTRKWWYRPVDEKAKVDLAWRFALSQKGVVAGVGPSFVDILETTIEVAKNYRPITPEEVAELQKMAAGCESIFLREEQQVALGGPRLVPVYPDSPHECCDHQPV